MVRRHRLVCLTQPTNVPSGTRRSQWLAQTSPLETLSETNHEEVPLVPEGSMTSEGAPTSPQTGPPTSASTQEVVGEPESQSPNPNPTEDDTHKHNVAHQEEFRKGPDDLLDDLLCGGVGNSTNDMGQSS